MPAQVLGHDPGIDVVASAGLRSDQKVDALAGVVVGCASVRRCQAAAASAISPIGDRGGVDGIGPSDVALAKSYEPAQQDPRVSVQIASFARSRSLNF